MPSPVADLIGLFTTATTFDIPAGTDVVKTAGYDAIGVGAAEYIYDASINAAFVTAHSGWSFVSSNGRGYRLARGQQMRFEMFGARADFDGTTLTPNTDSTIAWLRCRDWLHYHRRYFIQNTDYKATDPIHFEGGAYYFTSYLDLTDAAYSFVGSPSTELGGTHFYFSAGIPGIVLQSWDTQGIDQTKVNNVPPDGAQESFFSDIRLHSLGGTVESATQDGWRIKCKAALVRCGAFDFGGHGFNIIADVTYAGNANAVLMEACAASGNGRSGLHLQGGDVNACRNNGFQAFSNRWWGIQDESFLGNDHTQYQLDGNGMSWSGPYWSPTLPNGDKSGGTLAHRSGNRYRVVPGQHAAASTTAPGSDPGVWKSHGPGGIDGFYKDWANGTPYVSGGMFYSGGKDFTHNANSRSTFQGYCEPNQAAGWFNSETSAMLPGNSFLERGGAQIHARQNSFQSPAIGANVADASGRTYKNLLGTGFFGPFEANAACIRHFGSNGFDGPEWEEWCTSNNRIFYKFRGLFVSPMDMIGQSAFRPSGRSTDHEFVMQFGRGLYVGDQVFLGASNGQPADGSDDATGSIMFNRLPTAGSPWGWQKLVDGTWRALMP